MFSLFKQALLKASTDTFSELIWKIKHGETLAG